MSKKHGAEKYAMWAAHAPLFSFSNADADPTGGTGVESDPNAGADQGSVGVFVDQTNPATPTPAATDTYSPFVMAPADSTVPTFTPPIQGPVNTTSNTTASAPTPTGGLLADFKKQTSTVAGLQNLLTQATASGTTIAKQVAPLTKKGKKNADATAGKTTTGGGGGGKGTGDGTKVAGMSTPVIIGIVVLVLGGIVVGGLYAAGVIGGGSSSATTVPLVPNLVSKAA